jgi:hypothetical protein
MESASVAVSPALEGLETPYPDSEDSANTSDLAKLLARLDSDPEQAALEYEHLRRALIRFFDWRGASPADECADEALDRLTRRLSDTTVHDVYKYAHGIARLVLLERRRAPVMTSIDDVPKATLAAPEQRDDHSELQGCFDAWLDCLKTAGSCCWVITKGSGWGRSSIGAGSRPCSAAPKAHCGIACSGSAIGSNCACRDVSENR